MTITVAISGINAIDNPGPGTGIARSLKESGLPIRTIGLAYDSLEPGIYMDWVVDKSYLLPYPSGGSEPFLERLEYIHRKEKIDVVIPALDAELPLYINMQSHLKKMNIGIMIPTREMFRKRSKEKLHEVAQQIEIAVPRSFVMNNIRELYRADEELGYPLMIKGPFYEAYKVKNRSEAEQKFHDLAMKWGYPIIVQQFIVGQEYNLIGLSDGEGNDMGHVATKKMVITSQGKIWTNISIKNDLIDQAAHRFVTAVQWCGGYELEMMVESKTNTLYLIEINPRFPAWVYMATGCGINLPERMVRKILDMPYETHSNYDAGKILIRYTGELIKTIADFEKLTTLGEN